MQPLSFGVYPILAGYYRKNTDLLLCETRHINKNPLVLPLTLKGVERIFMPYTIRTPAINTTLFSDYQD